MRLVADECHIALGTLYNYYDLESDAKKEADSLNKESKCNGAQVKKEPRENFEK